MSEHFFSQKIRTLFDRFDLDKNGMIEVDDFEKWSTNIAAIGDLDADRSFHLTQSLMKIWQVYFLPADTNNDGSVEVNELVDHMQASLLDENKRDSIEATIPLIFDAIDSNSDGHIEVNEFAAYFSSLGILDSDFVGEVFKNMDTNHNGSLSKDEFNTFGSEFFFGTDQNSPARFFFGPLID